MNQIATRRGRRPSTPAFLRPVSYPSIPVAAKRDPNILALPSPDWLQQTVTFTGAADQIIALKEAAAGSGNVPWVYQYERMEEDWFHWLAGPTHRMKINTARILSRQLRDATWEMHERAVAEADVSKACPFDLHALASVPWEILRLGPDDRKAMAWCWENWATTWPLRCVQVVTEEPERWSVRFCSADWSPWPVLAVIRERFGVEVWVKCDYG